MNLQAQRYPGIFITFEGIDGAGKSTHINHFAGKLKEKYPAKKIILTREPGGTDLGEKLRTELLNQPMHPETEALLMFAARREHLAQIIEPALMMGDIVISDRFTDSSFAYQCGGRGISIEQLNILEKWVQGRVTKGDVFEIQPNKTFLFDLSVEIAQQRREQTRTPDKFEKLDIHFFNQVRNEYLRRASVFPNRIKLIDASLSIDTIRDMMELEASFL
ncbi:dTMP kinase [Polynucleobacter kasalickyi]|uniref:Thymidylate kinase n=1 Tax=Polynucleobacter kasalickyi TaxID=1938817 RepID=A0A1W2BGI3_9BURK|nr:dTMP kinase [Polynucleobacter kasalickyi]SMC71944.1 thymidylate kinase [Polynucleobacter kasalickyi]